MNSLVVLLSVMALAAAKPGFYEPGLISYAAPALAVAPAAVSHQSRIDIKSSPAIVATETVAPLTRGLAPAIVAAPAAYAAPVAYSAPAAYVAPTAYAAPLAVAAPAAVSSQSRVDIKSSPAVINTYAAPVLNTFAAAPVAYSAPIAAAPVAYSAPIAAAPVAYSAPIAATYSSSIYAPAIAPALPILKAGDLTPAASADAPALPVAPTETPEVAAARAAHLEAKALEESHKIQKRSLAIVSAPVVSSYPASPLISSYAGHVVYPAPVARVGTHIAAPILTSAYGIHPY